jgi:hypothetical protein
LDNIPIHGFQFLLSSQTNISIKKITGIRLYFECRLEFISQMMCPFQNLSSYLPIFPFNTKSLFSEKIRESFSKQGSKRSSSLLFLHLTQFFIRSQSDSKLIFDRRRHAHRSIMPRRRDNTDFCSQDIEEYLLSS